MIKKFEEKLKGIKNPILTVATALVFLVCTNGDFRNIQLLWWGSVALFILAFILIEKEFYFNKEFSLWHTIFIGFCVLSFFWAESISTAFSGMKSVFVYYVLLLLIASMIKTKEDLVHLFKILLFVFVFNSIYLVINNAFILTEGKGDRLGDSEWNANSIGMQMAVGALITTYLMNIAKNKKFNLLGVAIVVFFVFVVLITGSRKAILMVLLGISLFLILVARKNKKLFVLAIVIVCVSLIFQLIMTNELFYSILGHRIEELLAGITGEGTIDESTELRNLFAKTGIQVFKDNWIVGCGINCFRIVNGKITGHVHYAHNNYAEILADLGLIGTVIYYSIYLINLYELLKNYKKDKLNKLFLVVILLLFITDFGCVSYNSFTFTLLILLANIWGKISKNSEEKLDEKD